MCNSDGLSQCRLVWLNRKTDFKQSSLCDFKFHIFRHPLFPLMALLFEKCEALSLAGESAQVTSFDADIQTFVRHQEKEKRPFFSDNEELDGLVMHPELFLSFLCRHVKYSYFLVRFPYFWP